ncbi:MAG: hypothetical protein UT86_C0003G0019 [Candidatus Magasanikbacteria bacterium GW2011_GWC2_40_17]|uniref:Uncharacterized protein n=1 Tax=Candidatus Magasanikbacteria bacterium GW2011_GWA2_42_32 TaxID=1619039 RepID=A0A0G1A795_9BACT|nr:MAG: hypothetical protein UT86_C0003G0019 [Candidatus Magasanikbacteria bacterium GW2011_GWC2_40_17]KKS56922.1 MAG: hypothetical protein UV20_C0004G0018 [Candidatus Magasanikbacteria bacterium GW2011_GWA2_42_32]OGH85508.1 MAG: hypothetical protein A2294_03185 [Candidatus Magasanikbacteria bacterium RIFOXYB2_FULL_38_10]
MEAETRNSNPFLKCTKGWFESCIAFLKNIGVNLRANEASGDLLHLLEQSHQATADFWDGFPECQPVAGLEYRFLNRGLWPLIFGFDSATQELKVIFPLINAVRIKPTIHALSRFIKYRARLGKNYATKEDAEKEMLSRLLQSYSLEFGELRNSEERQRRYGRQGHFYAMEDKSRRAPLIFVLRYTEDKEGKPIVIIITCHPFKSSRATRTKPKTRDQRAAQKRVWTQTLEQVEE